MAQEQQEIRSVNWNEVFAFTHLFKCFRMAIQPSKLLLAAAALVIMFVVGLGMDFIWGGLGDKYVLLPAGPGEMGEIAQSATLPPAAFDKWRTGRLDKRLDDAATLKVNATDNLVQVNDFYKAWDAQAAQYGKPNDPAQLRTAFDKRLRDWNSDPNTAVKTPPQADILKDAKDKSTPWSSLKNDACKAFDSELAKIDTLLAVAEKDAGVAINALADANQKPVAADALKRQLAMMPRVRTAITVQFDTKVCGLRGMRISDALVTYEWNCIREAIRAAARGEFTGGLDQYRARMAARREVEPMAIDLSASQAPEAPPAGAQGQTYGVLMYVLQAYRGIVWLVQVHWVYALVYLAIALGVVALFGGGVNRMAALHFAREEKISASQALKFAAGKFFSFYTAPLIPVVLVLVLGVVMAAGGFLLLNVPGLDWLGGLFFFLAIALGFCVAFLLVGLVCGVGLMYPTIAAEGSDSFDAISRSYSYVLSRPWRAILYGAIASVYGAVTYLFVRLFAFVALSATHWFVKAGVASWFGGKSLSPDADRLDLMWTAPTFDNLFGSFSWAAMEHWYNKVPAFLIGAWVFLVACIVAGYLLSYAASATTVIYFLLRRKVDATDLDDVYVEETVEEPSEPAPAAPVEPAPAPAPAPTAAAQPSPAADSPTQTPPASDAGPTP